MGWKQPECARDNVTHNKNVLKGFKNNFQFLKAFWCVEDKFFHPPCSDATPSSANLLFSLLVFFLHNCLLYSSAHTPVPEWGPQAFLLQVRLRALVSGADGWFQPALFPHSSRQVTARMQVGAAGRGSLLLFLNFSLFCSLCLNSFFLLSHNSMSECFSVHAGKGARTKLVNFFDIE